MMNSILYGESDYPLPALWLEYNAPVTIDSSVTYEGATPFKYRKVKNTSQREEKIVGLKGTTYYTIIRTKYDALFKAKDKIKIGTKVYTIKTADPVENDLYKDARTIYPNFVDYETELILE